VCCDDIMCLVWVVVVVFVVSGDIVVGVLFVYGGLFFVGFVCVIDEVVWFVFL